MYDMPPGEQFPKRRWLCEAGAMKSLVSFYANRYPGLIDRIAGATDEMLVLGRIAANKPPPAAILEKLRGDRELAETMTDADSRAVLLFYANYTAQGDLRLWFADEGLLQWAPRDGFLKDYKAYLRRMADLVVADEEAAIRACLDELDSRARRRAAGAQGHLDESPPEPGPDEADEATEPYSEKESADA